ncbi:MAG TPA: leucyl aminopeptidase [Anaerolineaceae bacterium]|nr:leucyl aminopeptidase [Anaerolineaceae bacterium]
MAYNFQKPELPFHLVVIPAAATKPAGQIRLELVSAPEKADPGLPGPQAGDHILIQSGGQFKMLVSLGKSEKTILDTYRQAGGAAGKWLRQSGTASAEFDISVSNFEADSNSLQAFLEGLFLGAYQFSFYKEKKANEKPILIYLRAEKATARLKKFAERIETLASIIYLERNWAHEPGNVINPVSLAERLAALAEYAGLKCTVLDVKELEKIGAGGLVNVGKGSQTPPHLIIIEYAGNQPPAQAKPVVLVGKALTFDSGGYSLKSTEGIQGMKYDKSGGITVAATLLAAAELKIKSPVVGIIAAAENMLSDKAYRPDDIIKTLSGKTIEIVTTDAEGRLVLADALTYAQTHFQSAAIIDLATLTGGVLVALGRVRAGLMTNNEELAEKLLKSGEFTHERLWRLPLDEDYLKLIKGDDADLKNSGGREAPSIIGGIFIEQFIEDDRPWAHLDIAAVADLPKDAPYNPKGATGFGIRLLVHFLERF